MIIGQSKQRSFLTNNKYWRLPEVYTHYQEPLETVNLSWKYNIKGFGSGYIAFSIAPFFSLYMSRTLAG